MHLLAGDVARIDDGDAAIDLGLPPGDIVFLSAADTELALIGKIAAERGSDAPSVRFANLGRLSHPMSVDHFLEATVRHAKHVVVRCMGGASYWSYGLVELRRICHMYRISCAVIPGDDRWDPGLKEYSTVEPEQARQLWRYLVEGAEENARLALALCDHLIGRGPLPPSPVVLPHAGCYWPGRGAVELSEIVSHIKGMPVAAVVFYRALMQGNSTAPIDALIEALRSEGIAALPIFVASLKDAESEAFLDQAFSLIPPTVVLNTTAFAVSKIGTAHEGTVLDLPGRPVLQVAFAGSTWEDWQNSLRGLSPRDLTMNVVLPEVDGRIFTRAVSFKEPVGGAATYRQVPDRIAFVAKQAAAWVRLGIKGAPERKVALILSNYPDKDGRLANGVGLDTPESTVRIAASMAANGYVLPEFPETSAALMAKLLSGRTNAGGYSEETLSLDEYLRFFNALPQQSRAALSGRWGPPEGDPSFLGGAFQIAAHRFGNLVVGIQPARGYSIDPKATYHDPDLVPPHGYVAFYTWVRHVFGADAIVHLGKHGNLEWLPGKALGLSETCWPEVALGPTPLIYPFIVNDPGEGSQAKRRSSAVIVDHLMPPMTRAEIHGPLAELETLIDEYYVAAGVDRRRRDYLRREIVALAERHGLDRDLGITRSDNPDALRMLDAHLCELKEMQIRDGLHVLGTSPDGRLRTDTLVAIARTPRSGGRAADASLHRAIADDLGLGFDPLDYDLATAWTGPRPEALAVVDTPWRTNGDTVERIEALAVKLISPLRAHEPSLGKATRAVVDWIARDLGSALDRSGDAEIAAVLTGLDGRFVPPGPSGAPTRGRPDVLPTGRNFYSVDTRAVPTAAAWALGRKAADAVALRYFQDEGEWPRSIALSAWGTSNMRTGGDDIAQVLAFIGAAPSWEPGTGRVTGFKVLPLSTLGRPRIDVTLKISGMFRDAFPVQIDLIDSAVRAVAALDEADEANPIAAAAREAREHMRAAGYAAEVADHLSATRIFGAKPGAYGAGLQALIDTGAWETRKDFADAVLAWGSYAFGGGTHGDEAREAFTARLAAADAVLHNQDNREHDILDSDDYYQFQGGLAAAVEAVKGTAPRLYHGDHARPEKPLIRDLGEEIARVVRGRAANPKWIAGVMRHGYKGAFEMAATVDYLFAFAATTNAVQSHHFDQLFDAYIGDAAVRGFIAENNPPALSEMAARLREAIDRGLWAPRANSAYDLLSALVVGRKEAAE
ncbi:MAG TPA: cobaltochelatase subunit CobN [Bauldia sp.]